MILAKCQRGQGTFQQGSVPEAAGDQAEGLVGCDLHELGFLGSSLITFDEGKLCITLRYFLLLDSY